MSRVGGGGQYWALLGAGGTKALYGGNAHREQTERHDRKHYLRNVIDRGGKIPQHEH